MIQSKCIALLTGQTSVPGVVCRLTDKITNVLGRIPKPLSGLIQEIPAILEKTVMMLSSDIATGLIIHCGIVAIEETVRSAGNVIRSIADPLANIIRRVTKPLTGSVQRVINALSDASLMALHPAAIVIDFDILAVPPVTEVSSSIANPVTYIVICRLGPFSGIAKPIADPVRRIGYGPAGSVPRADSCIRDVLTSLGEPSADSIPNAFLFGSFLGLLRSVNSVGHSIANVLRRVADPLTCLIQEISSIVDETVMMLRSDIPTGLISHRGIVAIEETISSAGSIINSSGNGIADIPSRIPNPLSSIVHSAANSVTNVLSGIAKPLTGSVGGISGPPSSSIGRISNRTTGTI